jgi:hypothetical protein
MPYIRPFVNTLRGDPDPQIEESADFLKVQIPFGMMRPKSHKRTTSPLWIGADITKDVTITATLYGENITEPLVFALRLRFEVDRRMMTVDDVRASLDSEIG